MEHVFERRLAELENVFHFLERELAQMNIGGKPAFALKFVVEELFTNMVKYEKGSSGGITLEVHRTDDSCIVKMIDDDVDEFDVTRPPEVDVTAPIEDRVPGGLGMFLVNKLVDSIDYSYANRRSVITFSKRLD